MSFVAQSFLAAMLFAGVPALLHLLHRRRFKTVHWAAMDFLLDAVKRQRRWLEFRDLLLMLLRTLVVILFILAMARPYFVSGPGSPAPDGPVHAVLVIDNSLSMGYRPFDRTLLDDAKAKATDLINRLPDGSAVTLIPTCAVEDFHLREAYTSKEDALEALGDLRVVDRAGWAGRSAEAVRRALGAVDQLPTKRVLLVGDQQATGWAGGDLSRYFQGIEEVQVAEVGPASPDNAWIESFRLRDGFAGRAAPAVLLAQVRYEGGTPRQGVRVALRVGSTIVEERYLDLIPDQNLELIFEHTFDAVGTPDEPVFVPVSLTLENDRLPDDDVRHLIVPVVAAAPVVCIDSLGSAEDPSLNYLGESYPVRRLLRSSAQATREDQPAIQLRHLTPSQVTRQNLADARLVLLAGTAAPPAQTVELLRSYAELGGSLVITAGGLFEPEPWNRNAWRDGAGVLPLPLDPEPIGAAPAAGEQDVESFRLDPATVSDNLLDLGLPEQVNRRLLAGPYFFKAVGVDESATEALTEATRQRLTERRQWLVRNAENERRWAEAERRGTLSEAERRQREAQRARRAQMTSRWLRWVNPLSIDPDQLPLEELIDRQRPQVLARYDNGEAFAVRRRVGRGQIVLLTTGLLPRWNSLATDHAVILIDQMIRELVTQTIPSRNLGPVNEVVVPLPPAMAGRSFTLISPGQDQPRSLVPEAIGGDRLGLLIRDVHQRGVYRLIEEPDPASAAVADEQSPFLMLAVNGPGEEGDLARAEPTRIAEAIGEAVTTTFTPSDQPLTLSGKTYRGTSLWRWLLVLTLVLLLVEMAVLMAPHLRRAEPTAADAGEVQPA